MATSTFTSPQSFHLFPILPFELRALIWDLAVSNIPPRTISIQIKHHNERDDGRNYRISPVSFKLIFTSSAPSIPTPLLHTCRESRDHLTTPKKGGGGYYEKIFASDVLSVADRVSWKLTENFKALIHPSSSSQDCGATPRRRYIWVNFEQDTIDIGSRRFRLSTHYASKVKKIRFMIKNSAQPILDILLAAAPGGRRKVLLAECEEGAGADTVFGIFEVG